MATSTVTIEELHTYSLLSIFEYLSPKDRLSCSKVCEKWYEIVTMYGYISYLDIEFNEEEDKSPEFLEENEFAKHLNTEEVDYIFNGYPLTCFDTEEYIEHGNIHPEEFKEILQFSSRFIKHLNLTFNSVLTGNVIVIMDRHMYQTNFAALETLGILANRCESVRNLKVQFLCKNEKNFPKDEFEKLMKKLQQIEKLETVNMFSHSTFQFELDDIIPLNNLPKSLKMLTVFNSVIANNDESLNLFLQTASKLKLLRLGLNLITEKLLNSMTLHCTQLTDLTLFEISTPRFKCIRSSNALKDCISQLTNLQSLTIFAEIMNDDALIAICSNCNIRNLTLLCCPGITNTGLNKALSLLPMLECAHFYALNIRDWKKHTNLRRLKITMSPHLSEDALCTMVENSQHLESVYLNSCFENWPEKLICSMSSTAFARNKVFSIKNWRPLIYMSNALPKKKISVVVAKKGRISSANEFEDPCLDLFFPFTSEFEEILKTLKDYVSKFLPNCEVLYEIRE